jgi:hypothetical protein
LTVLSIIGEVWIMGYLIIVGIRCPRPAGPWRRSGYWMGRQRLAAALYRPHPAPGGSEVSSRGWFGGHPTGEEGHLTAGLPPLSSRGPSEKA